jgi:hypothetical protein
MELLKKGAIEAGRNAEHGAIMGNGDVYNSAGAFMDNLLGYVKGGM